MDFCTIMLLIIFNTAASLVFLLMKNQLGYVALNGDLQKCDLHSICKALSMSQVSNNGFNLSLHLTMSEIGYMVTFFVLDCCFVLVLGLLFTVISILLVRGGRVTFNMISNQK